MGLFGNKNKNSDVNEAPKAKKKKPKELMSSVLNESVVSTALDIMRSNDKFIFEDPKTGETKYAALIVRSEDLISNGVGGISKKFKNDEAKGSFIECVNSGKIATLITSELMDSEEIVIIPTLESLSTMEEFTMLTDAKYKWVYFNQAGDLERSDIDATFKDFYDVAMDKDNIQLVLGLESTEEEQYDELEDIKAEAENIPIYEEPEFDELLDESLMGVDETEIVDDYDNGSYDDTYSEENQDSEEIYEEEQVDDDIEYTSEDLRLSLSRIMNKGDLDIEISADAFDQQFVNNTRFVKFEVDRGDGWLAEQLRQLSMEANTDIEQFFEANIQKLRDKYLTLLSLLAEDTIKYVDLNNLDTKYGEMLQTVRDKKEEALDNDGDKIDQITIRMREDWQARVKEAGEAGRIEAEKRYKERHQQEYEANINNVPSQVKDEIEKDYNAAVNYIKAARLTEAIKRMDFGRNQILSTLANDYRLIMNDQLDLYDYWKDVISEFLDENRKHDIARTKALADELEQGQRINKINADYNSTIDAMKVQFENEKDRLQFEIDTMADKFNEKLKIKDESCDAKIQDARDSADKHKKNFDELLERFKNIQANEELKYENRIKTLENERETWKGQASTAQKAHNKVTIAIGTVALIGIIAAGAFGYIFGTMKKLDTLKPQTQQQQQQQVQSQPSVIYINPNQNSNSTQNNGQQKDVKPAVK